MPSPSDDYLSRWLDRTRRSLAPSGRLSEVALLLSRGDGRAPDAWSRELRAMLDGDQRPSLDLVTELDRLLAPRRDPSPARDQQSLF